MVQWLWVLFVCFCFVFHDHQFSSACHGSVSDLHAMVTVCGCTQQINRQLLQCYFVHCINSQKYPAIVSIFINVKPFWSTCDLYFVTAQLCLMFLSNILYAKACSLLRVFCVILNPKNFGIVLNVVTVFLLVFFIHVVNVNSFSAESQDFSLSQRTPLLSVFCNRTPCRAGLSVFVC